MGRLIQTLGWIPDLPDQRDHEFVPLMKATRIPDYRDLRHDVLLPILDQGNLGSCTGNGTASLHQFVQIKQKNANPFLGSRLFIYYGAREYLGTTTIDSGATIRDAVKVTARYGVPLETSWPYIIDKFKDRPFDVVYIEAEKHQSVSYQRIEQTEYGLLSCIAEGYPFIFGFSVYENFMSDYVYYTGDLQLPKPNEALMGGHCVIAMSYNRKQRKVLCQNSWGPFGYKGRGYFTMPFDYVLNPDLAADFWTIRGVE